MLAVFKTHLTLFLLTLSTSADFKFIDNPGKERLPRSYTRRQRMLWLADLTETGQDVGFQTCQEAGNKQTGCIDSTHLNLNLEYS